MLESHDDVVKSVGWSALSELEKYGMYSLAAVRSWLTCSRYNSISHPPNQYHCLTCWDAEKLAPFCKVIWLESTVSVGEK
jgi:hypothetical protein